MRSWKIKSETILKIILSSIILSVIINYLPIQARAETANQLQAKIDQRNQDIKALEKEVEQYKQQLSELGSQVSSLSATIKSLELTEKKLSADIKVTESKIANKNLEIQKLGSQIQDKEDTIQHNDYIIQHSFTTIAKVSDQSLLEILLSGKSFSDSVNSLDEIGTIQVNLLENIDELQKAKTSLEANRKASQKAKAELVTLNAQLKDQRAVTLSTRAEKNALLKQTKQSETVYKNILAEKQALQAQFEQEINTYESQLHLNVNPSLIPHVGSGVLDWPLDKIKITQYFGNTPFATKNAQVYNGRGHTGVDFGAFIGTPVKASLTGIVSGVGNSDIVRGCYSYGKWIMLKHANGLSTLYAHLSLQSISIGQEVKTGQIIGYSGNTGYSTGPHLHFGVYATQGVKIQRLTNSKNCTGAVIPVADWNAYLNPLSYL